MIDIFLFLNFIEHILLQGFLAIKIPILSIASGTSLHMLLLAYKISKFDCKLRREVTPHLQPFQIKYHEDLKRPLTHEIDSHDH